MATAQSPAMLFYLDNWLSVGPNSDFANGIPRRNNNYNWRRPPRPRAPCGGETGEEKRSGLNENYGRELMELHTLGVNGGYTQKDVTEVARVLTGLDAEAAQARWWLRLRRTNARARRQTRARASHQIRW